MDDEPKTVAESLSILDRLLEERYRPVPPAPNHIDTERKRQLVQALSLIAKALRQAPAAKPQPRCCSMHKGCDVNGPCCDDCPTCPTPD